MTGFYLRLPDDFLPVVEVGLNPAVQPGTFLASCDDGFGADGDIRGTVAEETMLQSRGGEILKDHGDNRRRMPVCPIRFFIEKGQDFVDVDEQR